MNSPGSETEAAPPSASSGGIWRSIATVLWAVGLTMLAYFAGTAVFLILAAMFPMAWTFVSAGVVASAGTLFWGAHILARRGPGQKELGFAAMAVSVTGLLALAVYTSSLTP
jgi:hypothetical protein